jgi:hypothetical protein
MEKVKNELQKALNKQELIEALGESYDLQEKMYDDNLDRMARLHEQIEAIKESNTRISNRMKDISDKLRKLQ